ncbi:MAG: alpha/beta hydrolase [SAR324 cluster bacterium]|uniref:Alpha/beta hydrolase n=1 Tax=SAR324 cluster bacterium TaxID=2024889 RepID=A0A7X9IL00_9DELT|nr:alpha/beta hydrolase [SAR324 cluster bacterium]
MKTDNRIRTVNIEVSNRLLNCSVLGKGDFQKTTLYCHGFPSSRLEALFLDDIARSLGITILSIDRPGFGGSTFYPERRIVDWPKDIQQTLTFFSLSKISILALSGGTPYGLVSACKLPSLVEKLVVVSGVSSLKEPQILKQMKPLHRFLIGMLQKRSRTGLRLAYFAAGLLRHFPCSSSLLIGCAFNSTDRKLVSDSQVRAIFGQAINEAFAQGVRGPVLDLQLMSNDWGFDLSEIQVPVTFIHGTDDRFVPPSMMLANASKITGAKIIEIPGEGHLAAVKVRKLILENLL